MRTKSNDTRTVVVALIDHLVPFGGAEILVGAIARRLDPQRFRSVVCATRTVDPAVRADLEAHGVEVLHLARTHRLRLDQWWRLARFLRRERVAVLHAHKFGSNVWAALLRRLVRVPVVVAHEHVWSFEGRPSRRLLDRYVVAASVDVTLTVSEETRRQMVEVERMPADRVVVFTHGVEPPLPARAVTRDEVGLPEDAFVVGTVCVLRPQKAVEQLVEAAALLAPRLPRLRVLVVGDGPERPELERLVGRLGLGAVVSFLGHRSDVADLLPLVDVCVSSSRFEGSPLAVMEFMGAGRAVVATAVGGVPELVEDGVSGLLVPPGDPARLAEAVERLAADGELRLRLGRAAAARQRTHFDLSRSVRRLEELYEELLAQRRAAHGPTRRPRLPQPTAVD